MYKLLYFAGRIYISILNEETNYVIDIIVSRLYENDIENVHKTVDIGEFTRCGRLSNISIIKIKREMNANSEIC